MRPSRPSSLRARSGVRAPTTRSWPPAPTGRWPAPPPRSSTSSGWAVTSCSGCASRPMRRSAPVSTWSAPSPDRVRPGSPTRCYVSVSAHDLESWLTRWTPTGRPAFSHPQWVVDAFREAVGDGRARRAARPPTTNRPAVTLVARPGRSDARRAARASRPPSRRTASCRRAASPGEVPAVAEGRAGVQDEGSQLVAHVLATAPIDGADERWLDLCAGPGGKAALLAALAADRGARLVANELQPHRAELVRRTARRRRRASRR